MRQNNEVKKNLLEEIEPINLGGGMNESFDTPDEVKLKVDDNGKVIMYADTISESMEIAIKETNRRRTIQNKYNEEHGIIPKTIIKEIRDLISNIDESERKTKVSKRERIDNINRIEEEMRKAAAELDFEKAMELRDIWLEMKSE